MNSRILLFTLGVFISGAAVATPLWPLLPQFDGMTYENTCGPSGAKAGTSWCTELNPRLSYDKRCRPGGSLRSKSYCRVKTPAAEYLYEYDLNKCGAPTTSSHLSYSEKVLAGGACAEAKTRYLKATSGK